jgi:hypothetical protein
MRPHSVCSAHLSKESDVGQYLGEDVNSRANQRKAGFGIVLPLQMSWRFNEDYFQRRPDVRFEQVATVGRAIRFADDDMGVDFRAIVALRDVAEQRQNSTCS